MNGSYSTNDIFKSFFINISPSIYGNSFNIAYNNVDLPEPTLPIKPINYPGNISKFKSDKTGYVLSFHLSYTSVMVTNGVLFITQLYFLIY